MSVRVLALSLAIILILPAALPNAPAQSTISISFDKEEYTVSERATISVKDRGANRDPITFERIIARVSSTSDLAGLGITLVETDPNSGIFVDTIGFTTVAESLYDVLRVSPGDIITASYNGQSATARIVGSTPPPVTKPPTVKPVLALDKEKYSPGDKVFLKGTVTPSLKLTILVLDAAENPYLLEDLQARSDGSFSFSFDLEEGIRTGTWLIEVFTGDAIEELRFEVQPPSSDTIVLTAMIRDFKDGKRGGHPDFEAPLIADDRGIVQSTLGQDGRPVYASATTTLTTTGKPNFDQWYRDVSGVNLRKDIQITLTKISDDPTTFSFSDLDFFPVDDELFGNEGLGRNFHFTAEIHASFTYRGGEVFTFTGDDDTWVFINNELVMDLGGIHPPETQRVNLDSIASSIGITMGNSYNLDIFHAERHTVGSIFRMDTTILLQPVSREPSVDLTGVWKPLNPQVFGIQVVNPIIILHQVGQAISGYVLYEPTDPPGATSVEGSIKGDTVTLITTFNDPIILWKLSFDRDHPPEVYAKVVPISSKDVLQISDGNKLLEGLSYPYVFGVKGEEVVVKANGGTPEALQYGAQPHPTSWILEEDSAINLQTEPELEQSFVLGETLIGLRDGVDPSSVEVKNAVEAVGGQIIEVLEEINVLRISVPEGSEEAVIEELQQSDLVKFAGKNNYLVPTSITISDEGFRWQQKHYQMINVPDAWSTSMGSHEVIVAVIDSGIDFDHPDLQGNIWVNDDCDNDGIDDDSNGYIDDCIGWNFSDSTNNIMDEDIVKPEGSKEELDCNSHGTHVAGIVGAISNEIMGLGVSPNVSIMPLKVFAHGMDAGQVVCLSDESLAANAINYAADNGARVINLSLGCPEVKCNVPTIEEALKYAFEKGALVVAAAGNNNRGIDDWQDHAQYLVEVSSVSLSGELASYSNLGPGIKISAPGSGVYSTMLDDTARLKSGTSQATPMVAGCAALLLSVDPSLNNVELERILTQSAKDMGEKGRDDYYGYGLLDCNNALQMLKPSELLEADISVAMKHKKKLSLISVKNNGDEEIFGVQMKIEDGKIRFVKAKKWDRERIDQSTVLVQTDDRPIRPSGSLIILLVVDNKSSSIEWKVLDDNERLMRGGNVTPTWW